MKKILLATVALMAFAAAAPAFGADLGARPYYSKAPAPVYAAPIYNWTGFYVGGHIGGAFTSSDNFNGFALSDRKTRFLGGVQVGGDWQFHPNFLVGVEGQYSWLGGDQVSAAFPGGFVYNNDQRGIGSITGRVGWTWGPGLIYAKGGYAYSDNNETLRFGGVPVGFALSDRHRNGFTVGGGIEYMFAPNWSAKAEYQFYDFGDSRFVAPAPLVPFGSFHNDEHTVKAGINYRFNFGNFGGPLATGY
ncbi:outer membrane beta-barrel protein [Bradyrhizobium sp. 31Argb]|uniref:outer membrane protein n=1 Tax=Bradyrhizobium sp. 31Argb TaxID=3141247 RepID=UPI00374A97BC